MSAATFHDELVAALPNVVGWCVHLKRSPDAGADLAQKTALRALEHENGFTLGTDMKAWLMRMAFNLHVNENRSSRVKCQHLDIDDVVLTAPESQSARDDLIDCLAALRTLPINHQRILLAAGDDLNYLEIGERLRLRPGTVRSRLNRAREALLTALA